MKILMNVTTSSFDTQRYSGNAALKAFYRALGLNGLELLHTGEDSGGLFLPEDVIGVHLKYFTAWMDLWTHNKGRLLAEYDDEAGIHSVFGGNSPASLIAFFRQNLADVLPLRPEYLVYHVSECTIPESMLRQYHYSDEAVVDGAAALLNQVMEAVPSNGPLLLFENLWYSGLSLLRPEITARLLEKVQYPNTGVMLDTGHLLHTGVQLRSLDEGLNYLHTVLDGYRDLSFIKGVHLHQTLSGAYAEELMQNWQPRGGSYQQRFAEVLPHIYKIDSHSPFLHPGVKELIQRISPEYLVLEFMSANRDELGAKLQAQMQALG